MEEENKKESNRDHVFALFNDDGEMRRAIDALKNSGYSVEDRNVWEDDDVGERPTKSAVEKPEYMLRVKIDDKSQFPLVEDLLKKLGGHHIDFIEHTMKAQSPPKEAADGDESARPAA